MNIGPRVDFPGDTVSWIDVYNSYPDFRAALARGMIVRGLNAGCVLGRMEGYVGMNWGWRKEDVGVNVRMDGKLGNEDGDGSWADGLIARPLPDVPVETAGDDAEEEHRSEEDGSEDDEDERVPWIDVAESFRADSDEDMEDGLD